MDPADSAASIVFFVFGKVFDFEMIGVFLKQEIKEGIVLFFRKPLIK